VELAEALDLARGRHQGALLTIGREGRPQISNIAYAMDDDGVARISTTADTVKARNIARDPRSSLYVPGGHFYQYVVLDGTAVLSAVAAAPDDPVVGVLVQIYGAVAGEHPDWDEFRQAMVRDRRMVITVRPEHAYGMLGG
jgi:PPOX class probable F420-dependent enzyme